MRTRLAVVAAVVVLGTAGCNRDDNPTIEVDPGVTTTTEAPGATSTTGASTATTVAAGPARTPEAAAEGLFGSWEKGDRQGASRYASQKAIDELFKRPNTGGVEYNDQGCSPQGGAFDCAWTYPGGALHMTVEDVPGGGYIVNLVTSTAD